MLGEEEEIELEAVRQQVLEPLKNSCTEMEVQSSDPNIPSVGAFDYLLVG
jgi:hypothetical protein